MSPAISFLGGRGNKIHPGGAAWTYDVQDKRHG